MSNSDFPQIFSILSNLDIRASAVWVSFLATQEKIEQLAKTPWHDPTLDRYANKVRMKELGGATMNYTAFLGESLFAALAKSLEDFWIDLRLTAGLKYDIWKSPLQPMYLKEARVVRSISNLIKHNQSFIESASSEHAKFLVAEAGFPDSTDLKTLFLAGHAELKMLDMPYLMYLYSLDLIRQALRFEHPVLEMAEVERRKHVCEHLVPPVLQLKAT